MLASNKCILQVPINPGANVFNINEEKYFRENSASPIKSIAIHDKDRKREAF